MARALVTVLYFYFRTCVPVGQGLWDNSPLTCEPGGGNLGGSCGKRSYCGTAVPLHWFLPFVKICKCLPKWGQYISPQWFVLLSSWTLDFFCCKYFFQASLIDMYILYIITWTRLCVCLYILYIIYLPGLLQASRPYDQPADPKVQVQPPNWVFFIQPDLHEQECMLPARDPWSTLTSIIEFFLSCDQPCGLFLS